MSQKKVPKIFKEMWGEKIQPNGVFLKKIRFSQETERKQYPASNQNLPRMQRSKEICSIIRMEKKTIEAELKMTHDAIK